MATLGANLAAANLKTLQGRHSSAVYHRKSVTITAVAPPRIETVEVSTTKTTTNWASAFCDHLERAVLSWSGRGSGGEDACEGDEECYLLAENYAPVPEMAPTAHLPVIGTLPACLNGQFLLNGPNPKFEPVGGYHWFDGDGMIHALKIQDGKASYAARYVRTSRLVQEERYGAPKFLKLGDMTGMLAYFLLGVDLLRKTLGVLDASNGEGTGNTALVFHNNKLLALQEKDKPYHMKVLQNGDLQTMKIEDYAQKLNHPFTAHPKIDRETGEMFMFAYNMFAPHLIYRVVSKVGILGNLVAFTMPSPTLMHDFAISKNYAIFIDVSVCFNPLIRQMMHKKSHVINVTMDGISQRVWQEVNLYSNLIPTKNLDWAFSHAMQPISLSSDVNAWEEGDEVILTCCQKEKADFRPDLKFKIEKAFGTGSTLHEYRLNLKSGEVKHKQLSNLWTEFPQINQEYTGRKVKYAYCSVIDDYDRIVGVAKYDLSMEALPTNPMKREFKIEGNIVGAFYYGKEQCGQEAIFVPRKRGMGPDLEDDGYLLSFVYDDNTIKSEVIVIDAKTMMPNPVAIVKLPRRVPHGFHAHFVSEEQLQQQS